MSVVSARAQTAADLYCPTPGEPCKVLIITAGEEQVLTQQGGVLDTAAKARMLDLGNVVAYFTNKIALAPAGKIVPKPEAKKGEESEKRDGEAKK